LGADFLFRDVASLFADPPDLPMLAVAEPPDAAADEGEKDKDDGEGAEDFILPELERPPQLGELIAEALDLELDVGVILGFVVKVAVVSPFVAVSELQGAALSLVAGNVGMRRIIRKVEALERRVATTSVSGEEEPRLFLLLASIEELELGVGDPTIVRIHRGGSSP
jgi:hypothetical protein